MRFSAALLLICTVAWSQPPAADAIARGEKIYGARCSVCHGRDGKGGQAPSLHGSRIVVLSPDRRLFDVVKNGIPGSGMPPLPGTDADAWDVVRFVQSLAKPGMGLPVPGDPQAGRAVFAEAGCARCHIVEGKGGVLGPDLSSIANQSSSAEIRESVLEPASKVRHGFRTVALRTHAGSEIEGILKNEDNFSIQLMTANGELRSFARAALSAVEPGVRSLMPEGAARNLSPEQLRNLLAFLDRQRAPHLRSELGFQNY